MKINIVLLFYAACALLVSGCTENHPSSTARIILELTSDNREADGKLLHAISPLSRKESKGGMPSDIISFTLTISAADMSTISRTYPADTSQIEIEVPAGNARLFSLTATAPTQSYRGNALTDLSPGETTTIYIAMAIADAHVIISVTGVPTNAISLTLDVTATDMNTLTQNYPAGTNPLEITVPAGVARTFKLSTQLPSVRFGGSTIANCQADANTNISITMALDSARIIVPDYMNNRIVQMDDMNGQNWTELSGNTLISDPNMNPLSVDFDFNGKMYILHTYNPMLNNNSGIIRVDDINGAGILSIANRTSSPHLTTMTIDRINGHIYYADENKNIYQTSLDGNVLNTITAFTAFYSISGMTVDPNGNLYIGMDNGQWQVNKFDPKSLQSLGIYTDSNLGNPGGASDLLFKNGSLYIANPNGSSGFMIIQIDPATMTFVAGFGTLINTTEMSAGDTTDIQSGHFGGPLRFISKLNSTITLVDRYNVCGDFTHYFDRLVAFNDFTFSNWAIYGKSGNGTGFFNLYYVMPCK